MLKTTGLSAALASRADGNEVAGGNSADSSSSGSGGGSSASKEKSAKYQSQNSGRNLVNSGNSKTMEKLSFLISKARKTFNRLKQVFIKAPILRYFDLECHIRIKTDTSSYAIGGVLCQLIYKQLTTDKSISPKSIDWHPIAYFFRKIIPAETWYKTHDGELLAIVEIFMTWQNYLESCKHKVFVFTNHNNLCQFIDTKSLSSRQVWWALKLSHYHFQIDYC